MKPLLMDPSTLFNRTTSMIALTERSDCYLMKVDLPSLPMQLGDIVSSRNELVVETPDLADTAADDTLSDLIRIRTLGGSLHAVYREGALYILLPKTA